MKPKRVITVVISLMIGFSIGLMSGLTLTNPGMNLREAAGTIGRVDQYRNVRITQQDIELRNDLIEDEQRRENFIGYLTYEYVNNIQAGENVRLAMASSQSAGNFSTTNRKTMEQLGQYAEFLDNARLRILEAIGALQDLGEKDKVAIHTVLKDAGNVLAQNSLRSSVLFDFMMDVERFFQTTSPVEFPDLANAHDRIFASLVSENLIKGNRSTLNQLLTKELLGDMEILGAYWDAEQLEFYVDSEQLGRIIAMDSESLGSLLFDSEQLGQMLRNIEQLGRIIAMDSESLGTILYDSEQLGQMLRNSEQLGFFDSEQLGYLLYDTEQLGAFRDASEQLQLIVPF